MKKAICMFISAFTAVVLVSCGCRPEDNVVSLNSLPVSSEQADIISSNQPVSSEAASSDTSSEAVSSDISSETVLSSESVSDSAESSKNTVSKEIYQMYSEDDIIAFFEENREIFEKIKDEMFKYDDADIYVQYKKKSEKIVINKEIGEKWEKEEEITDNERLERALEKYYSIDEPIDISESNYWNEILLKKDEDAKYRLLEFCLDDSSACQYIYYYEGEITDIVPNYYDNITRLGDNWYIWWFGKI